jgi:hypothetical protein
MDILRFSEFVHFGESYVPLHGAPIEYDCCCADINQYEWDRRMKGAKPYPYEKLVAKIKKYCKDMYDYLMLNLRNPYSEQTYQTKDYYVLTHSATEYFFKKNKRIHEKLNIQPITKDMLSSIESKTHRNSRDVEQLSELMKLKGKKRFEYIKENRVKQIIFTTEEGYRRIPYDLRVAHTFLGSTLASVGVIKDEMYISKDSSPILKIIGLYWKDLLSNSSEEEIASFVKESFPNVFGNFKWDNIANVNGKPFYGLLIIRTDFYSVSDILNSISETFDATAQAIIKMRASFI